jgi:hypothetical protein
MALPKAIEKQAADAEELRKSVYEGQADGTEVPQPASNEPPVALEPPANVVPLPTNAEPAAVTPPQPAQDALYWQKRFETVQGKLDAEMPRLFQQIRDQGEMIRKLSAQLAERNAPPAADETLVTQKDIDAYGEDLIDAMRRTAREEARKAYAAEREALEKKFGAVESQVGQVSQRVEKNAVDTFWGEVLTLVPDWLSVDQNPSWIAWLDTSPEFATNSYRELAAQAISKGNPRKIAKLVEAWKKESGQAQVSPPPPPPPAPIRQQQSELERQVTPSTARSSTPPPAQKILTRAEYETLYDVRNVQRYGEKKAAEMIAEADLAVTENRVRWT